MKLLSVLSILLLSSCTVTSTKTINSSQKSNEKASITISGENKIGVLVNN